MDDSIGLLGGDLNRSLRGRVQLILTSPPFPLNKKKKYGNLAGAAYQKWFESLAGLFSELLSPSGSIVIELGNAWEHGRPVQSTLHMEALLGFLKHPTAGLRLCQEMVCYNPARLPSPAQWVTVHRLRLVDSYTHIWWMARTDYPKADNRRVLRPYSSAMRALLSRGKYNSGRRPSEHTVSETGFLNQNNGSIAHNLFQMEPIDDKSDPRLPLNVLKVANTTSRDAYLMACREKNMTPHPARMPAELAAFFIEYLTDEGDLVLDPFAGSNTTGVCADLLNRRWVSIDAEPAYAEHSIARLVGQGITYEQ